MDYPSDSEEQGRNRKLKLLLAIGFIIMLFGISILIGATMLSGDSVNFGGVVIIGLFPIIVGAGTDISWIIFLAIILSVLNFILFMIMRKEKKD